MRQEHTETSGAEIARAVAKRWAREAELVPVSHLSLDVAEPISGWTAFFATRGVEVVDDDLGRPCVRREVLGDLLSEERERLARIEAESAARAAAAVAPVPIGVPAQEGSTPLESLMAAGYTTPQEEFGRPAPNFLAEELDAGARQQAAEVESIRRRKERAEK